MTEVVLNIKMKGFRFLALKAREEAEDAETFSEAAAIYRKRLSENWDCFRNSPRRPKIQDRSYQSHFVALRAAAMQVMQFGATDSQIRLLASLNAAADEPVEHMSRLTKAEASVMIDSAKRRNY